MVTNKIQGSIPALDLQYEAQLHKLCQIYAKQGLVNSMHDISDGGLIISLIESLNKTDFGCSIDIKKLPDMRMDFVLFSESQSRIIISCPERNLNKVLSEAKSCRIDAKEIGIVTGDKRIKIGTKVDLSMDQVLENYNNSIGKVMPAEGD
jgi:phosphoribosylformylglycinamidine synthase subunit PurL